jgi:hypothetical protein
MLGRHVAGQLIFRIASVTEASFAGGIAATKAGPTRINPRHVLSQIRDGANASAWSGVM